MYLFTLRGGIFDNGRKLDRHHGYGPRIAVVEAPSLPKEPAPKQEKERRIE